MQLDYIAANVPFALNTPLGPFIQAIVYATALVGLVLQRLIQIVLNVSRLSTSTGDDVDSFVEDFGLFRLPGNKATGTATLSRIVTAVSQIPIPIGTRLQTNGNPAVIFQVVANNSNPNFDLDRNAYLLQSGAISVDVSVEAIEVGIIGNLNAGDLAKIASPLPGIDNVINGAAFVDGAENETDDELRVRFALYIQSLSKSTMTAIASSVANVQAGLIYTITENVNIDGTANNGQFVVAVDDGTGSPSNGLLDDIRQAVENSRPVGVRPIITGPTLVRLVCLNIVIAYDSILVPDAVKFADAIQSLIADYINGTSFRDTPRLSIIYKTVWNAISPGDAVDTVISPLGVSTSNQLYVANTQGMQIGQLVNVQGILTATGAYPKIISIETDLFIVVFPPLLSAPSQGTPVETFSLIPGQILNVNNPITIGLLFGTVITVQAAGGFTGCAFNGSYAGVTGISTRIYLQSSAGIVIGETIIFNGFQPDPATALPTSANMIAKVAAIDTPTNSIIITPPLGVLAADGSWTMVQPSTGVAPFIPIGITAPRAAYSTESTVGPGSLNLAQVARTTVDKINVILTTTPA